MGFCFEEICVAYVYLHICILSSARIEAKFSKHIFRYISPMINTPEACHESLAIIKELGLLLKNKQLQQDRLIRTLMLQNCRCEFESKRHPNMNKKLALWRKWPQHREHITDWQKCYVLSIPVTNF